jgi:5-methylcytosine-specific restriction endonuclease McrA
MSPPRLCLCCHRFAVPGGSRCELHALPRRSGSYTRNAKRIVENAVYCYLCGGPFTDVDPAVADHVLPRVHGGSDDISNLAPAHRSCNGRKGATLAGVWIR